MSLSRGPKNLFGGRLRARREALGWSLEKVGVAIGLDESSARARVSRYELNVHEPSLETAAQLALVLGVPLAYLYCPDDEMAEIILAVGRLDSQSRSELRDWLRNKSGE